MNNNSRLVWKRPCEQGRDEDLQRKKSKSTNCNPIEVGLSSGSGHAPAGYRSMTENINTIFEKAKEEALKVIETAKIKAQKCIQTAFQTQEWLEKNEHHSDVEKETASSIPKADDVNTLTDNDKYNDVQLESVVKKNLNLFFSYIADSVKVTDLIAFYDLFGFTQTKELRSIFKRNPLEASEKAFEYIQMMSSQPTKYRHLLSALDDAGYPKVVKILKGDLVPVGSPHRQTIRICAKHVFRRLNTTDLLPYLHRKKIINDEDKEQIIRTERTETTGIAALELLDLLPNRHERWFRCFIDCLVESGHEELGNIIEATYNQTKADMNRKRDAESLQILMRIQQRGASTKSKLFESKEVRNMIRSNDSDNVSSPIQGINTSLSATKRLNSPDTIKCLPIPSRPPATARAAPTAADAPISTLTFSSALNLSTPSVLSSGSVISAASSDEMSCVSSSRLDRDLGDFATCNDHLFFSV